MPTTAPRRFKNPVLLAALCSVAAACAPFEFEAQELVLRHDREGDSLELGIVYEGLICDDMDDGPIQRLAAAERIFILLGWPFVFDLDGPESDIGEEDLPPELKPRVRALAKSLEVTDAVLFGDEQGRLGAVQRLRLTHASEGMATLNALIGSTVIESLGDGSGDDEEVDARSRELMLAHAWSGRQWLLLVDGGFEVHVPMSTALAARNIVALASLPDEQDLDTRRAMAGLLAPLSEVSYDDELLVLRFLPDGQGHVRFGFELGNSPDDQLLLQAFQDEQIEVPIRTLAWARKRARDE